MAISSLAESDLRSPAGLRWMGVGASRLTDSRAAGAAAATRAVQGRDIRLLIVFASARHDLTSLAEGIAGVCPDAPMIGCTTAGEIATDGPAEASVVVTALGGEGFSVATAAAEHASQDLRAAGARAATCADRVAPRQFRLLLLLTDGLGGDQQEVVRGAYSVVGSEVPLVGGCAGDDLAMQRTHQLHNGRALQDSIVAAAITSDSPFGIGVQHGWRRVGDPMLVTESRGTRVYEIDNRPALDAYLNRLQPPDEVRTDPSAFTRFALTHPLGLSRRSGEEVRFIAEANFDDRSIGCIAEVPQGGLAWIMEGDNDSVLDATDAACRQALEALDNRTAIGVLAFDCIARRGVLGEDGIHREVERITTHTPRAPVAGFYTYGEIARVRGISGFHNQTLVVLAFS